MKAKAQPKKFGIDIRWLFRICILVGFFYLTKWPGANDRELARGFEFVAAGVLGLIAMSIIKRNWPNAFNYYSIAEMIQMKMPDEWRNGYERLAVFMMGRGLTAVWVTGWIVLMIVVFLTKGQTVFGFRLGPLVLGWFFGAFVINLIGGLMGMEEIAERKQMEAKLKPIPPHGDKVELYEFKTGKALAHITAAELQFLIDSFREWGMADNDFYFMRETLDLFEQQKADPHLVATLRQIMGKKNDMEIGWTLV